MKTVIDYRLFVHIFITLLFSYYSINKREDYDFGWLLIIVAVMSFSWVVISLVNNVRQTGIFYKKNVYLKEDFRKNHPRKPTKK